MVKNDKTDPDGLDGNAAAAAVDCAAVKIKGGEVAESGTRAVDCPANESKGGAVAELAPRNVSNLGKGGRLLALVVGPPLAPKYGSIGGSAAASAGAAAALANPTAAAAAAVVPALAAAAFALAASSACSLAKSSLLDKQGSNTVSLSSSSS